MRNETEIRDKIFLALGRDPKNLIFRRNVGLFYTKYGAPIRIGMNGEADLQGFLGNQHCEMCHYPIHPKPFCVEVKDPNGEQSKDQVKFQNEIWERRGLLYVLASSVEQALEGVYESDR